MDADDVFHDPDGDAPAWDEDDTFDELVRDQLSDLYPVRNQSLDVLDELRPAVRRARRRRAAGRTLGWVSATACIVAVAALSLPGLPVPERETLVAGPADSVSAENVASAPSGADSALRLPTPADDVSDQSVAGASSTGSPQADGEAPNDGADDSQEASSATIVAPASSTSAETTTSDTTATQSTPSVTEGSPAPTNGATSSTVPGIRVESSCGVLVYDLVDGALVILDVEAADQRTRVDIKSDEPSKLELSIEGGRDHCELKVELVNGQAKVSIEEE